MKQKDRFDSVLVKGYHAALSASTKELPRNRSLSIKQSRVTLAGSKIKKYLTCFNKVILFLDNVTKLQLCPHPTNCCTTVHNNVCSHLKRRRVQPRGPRLTSTMIHSPLLFRRPIYAPPPYNNLLLIC